MFAAALVAITGCCNCTSRSREVKPLVGTDWHLVQIMGRDVQKPADSYTITFGQDGRLNGVGDCNRLMSEYKTDDSRKLTFEYPALDQNDVPRIRHRRTSSCKCFRA